MLRGYYAIYDTAAMVYMNPVLARTRGEAERVFEDLAQDANHPIGAHPEDYSLFYIGDFNDNTGELTNQINQCLCTGLEAVAKARNVKKDQLDIFDQQVTEGENDDG